jgi:ankyrin repeat protein
LSRAAEKGYKAIVELLLKNGAQADFDDADGQTPLSRALRAVEADIVQLLINHDP